MDTSCESCTHAELTSLSSYRPDLKFGIIPARPSGLGVVANLNPKSTILVERLDEIMAEYGGQELPFDYGQIDRSTVLKVMPGVVANDWKSIAEALLPNAADEA
jgi:hypothetical protein